MLGQEPKGPSLMSNKMAANYNNKKKRMLSKEMARTKYVL